MANLNCFAPHVRRHLEEIIKHGKIGLCPGMIKIMNPMPSCPPYAENAECDRFKISIPYGGHSVTWEVLFYAPRPELPPDFIFHDCQFFVALDDVEPLARWDVRRADGLLRAIRALLRLYRRRQVALLEGHARVHFEYAALVQQAGVHEDDVEVLVGAGAVHFLVRLDVDFSGIPPVFGRENPGEDAALLLVTFHPPEGGGRVTPKLFLSPRVEHALAGAHFWRIPTLSSQVYLMEYVPFVREALAKKVRLVAGSYERRRAFVAAFLGHRELCAVEYDVELFSKLVLLLESNDFYFLLQIDLPPGFPHERPLFTFRSVYHTCAGKPFSQSLSGTLAPTLSAHEMYEKTMQFVREHAPTFQQNSVRS